jgi:GNAT superfamily N-acetyltransferase
MTAAILAATSQSTGRMRPLNVLRDLPSVADLIEMCFSSTLDPDGRSYIDQMRRNGLDRSFLNWAPRVIETVSLPLSGFVWESSGRVVGNVSLIPFFKREQKIYLIANVATHPDYRRQGIARQLTSAAMQKARDKRASAIWLHVRDDNPGAIQLYRELGFVERSRRTNWQAPAGTALLAGPPSAIKITRRLARDWGAQSKWLARAYPAELDWYNRQNWDIFRPGLIQSIYRFMTDINTQQWSAQMNGQLQGILALQRGGAYTDQLWAALPAHANPDAVTALLCHARQLISPIRSLALEYPAGAVDAAIRATGLVAQRTLAWMEAPGVTTF